MQDDSCFGAYFTIVILLNLRLIGCSDPDIIRAMRQCIDAMEFKMNDCGTHRASDRCEYDTSMLKVVAGGIYQIVLSVFLQVVGVSIVANIMQVTRRSLDSFGAPS